MPTWEEKNKQTTAAIELKLDVCVVLYICLYTVHVYI